MVCVEEANETLMVFDVIDNRSEVWTDGLDVMTNFVRLRGFDAFMTAGFPLSEGGISL